MFGAAVSFRPLIQLSFCSCQGVRDDILQYSTDTSLFYHMLLGTCAKLLPANPKMWDIITSKQWHTSTFFSTINLKQRNDPSSQTQHILVACPHNWFAVFINPMLKCHFQAAQSSQRCPGLAFFLTCDKHKMAAPTPVGLHKTVKTSLHPLPSTSAPRTLLSTAPPARNSLPARLPAGVHAVYLCCINHPFIVRFPLPAMFFSRVVEVTYLCPVL